MGAHIYFFCSKNQKSYNAVVDTPNPTHQALSMQNMTFSYAALGVSNNSTTSQHKIYLCLWTLLFNIGNVFFFFRNMVYWFTYFTYVCVCVCVSPHLKAVVLPEDAAVNRLDDNLVLHT